MEDFFEQFKEKSRQNWSPWLWKDGRCSTWNMARLGWTLFFLLACACNKPDPNPELKDRVYLAMDAEKKRADSEVAGAEKQLEEFQQSLKQVKPQTGQIRYAQKRVFETERLLDKLRQKQKYWAVRMTSRRDEVRLASMKAFQKGETWNDSKDYEAYAAERKMREAGLHWDANKRREEFLKKAGLNKKKVAEKAP